MAPSSCIPVKKLCSDAAADAADLLLQLAAGGGEESAAAAAILEAKDNVSADRKNAPAASAKTYRSPSISAAFKHNATTVTAVLSSPLNKKSATSSPVPVLPASIKHCRRRRSPTFEYLGIDQANSPIKLSSEPPIHQVVESSSQKQNELLTKKDSAGNEAAAEHESSALKARRHIQNCMKSTEKLELVTSSTSGHGRLEKVANCKLDNAVNLPSRPHPLRASSVQLHPSTVVSSSDHMNPRAVLKLMFDREYESLLQWRKIGFQIFTEEVQETLGAILKQSVTEYKEEFEIQMKHSVYHNVNAGADEYQTIAHKSYVLADHDHRLTYDSHEEISRISYYNNSCELSPGVYGIDNCKISENYTPCSDAIPSAVRAKHDSYCARRSIDHQSGAVHEEYFISSNPTLPLDQGIRTIPNRRSSTGGGALAANLVQNSNDTGESAATLLCSTNIKEKSLEAKLVSSLSKAMEAVVSVREAAQRIETHRSWMNREMDPARLELMNLRFSGSYSINDDDDDDMDRNQSRHASVKSYTINRKEVNLSTHTCEHEVHCRGILREAMDLSDTVRAFIMELSSALAQNEHGVPWPLSRTADCSDVTPHFIDKLAGLISTSDQFIN